MKLFVIGIVLMLIFLGMCIFIFKNESKIENNSTDLQTCKTNNLNKTLNYTNIDNENSSNKYYMSTKFIEKNKYSDNNKSNNTTYDSASMDKKLVEKYVLDKNQIAKYPVYKERGNWLVPIFDKKTGKFVGSVFSGDDPMFLLFTNGPDSYYEYKELISGKTIHKTNSNKDVDHDKSNILSKTIAVGKSNTNTSIDYDLVKDIAYNINQDTFNLLNLENEEIIKDSDSIDNSTC